MARRELEIASQPGEEQPATKQARAVEVAQREERCCAVYEEAVKTLPTGELLCHVIQKSRICECETDTPPPNTKIHIL